MKKNLKIVIIMILIISMCSAPCFASSIQELQERQEELNTQIDEKNEELTGVQTEISDVLQEIQTLTDDINKYENEVKELTTKTNELIDKVKELEEKLKIAEENYENQRQLLEDRLVYIYESGEVSYLDVLLNTRSISEFISTYFYLNEMIKNDEELLNDLEREKVRIAKNKEELAKEKEELKKVRNDKERAAIVLENKRILQNAYKEQLSDSEKQLQTQIEEYEKELQEIEAEIIALTTLELGEEYTGGVMAWPVPGYTRITSAYGMRLHPILGVYKLHTGIDIGAPTGANFIAVSDGVVIKACENTSYGKMVVIDHGGGVTTLYAHGSEILVTVGQTVKRGEPVLKVGSTGYSTGPHAHFEVRINGSSVQPLNYLKKTATTTSGNTIEQ
ncbi:MAG: peptidoglycan DD-metalloendopeptidase family protein [Clostridia bacterium]|nr:peptidoglycan DD-metalloendopeptidase family protein [Clostridia bacterium]